MPEPQRPDYRQHLLVETPEHVVLDHELAGIGSRTLAAMIDWAIIAVLLVCSLFLLFPAAKFGTSTAFATLVVFQFIIIAGYFTFFEGLRGGRTPGKRLLGLRVIHDTGHPVTLGAAFARSLMNLPDLLLVGVILIAAHPRAKRLGDLVAGTVVVRDRPVARTIPTAAALEDDTDATAVLGAPRLSDEEFRLLREFEQRRAELPPATLARLAAILSDRLGQHLLVHDGDTAAALGRLFLEEQARRRGQLGGRGAAASPRSQAEQLIARKSARWDAFQLVADRVARSGLDSLTAGELPDFAARYREVAADLARARTYRADPAVLQRLERLVGAGHNALYRKERGGYRSFITFLFQQCPAEIVSSWRVVAVAHAALFVPMLAGYVLLRQDPALADTVVPAVMLERAAAADIRLAASAGYLEADAADRPMLAAQITVNNIRVAMRAFTGGIALGVGSLLLLAFNGLHLGTSWGHFVNVGMGTYLWTFIAGHGVFELFAIALAGAAGFLLGFAVIAPGPHSRGDALVLAGRRAIRLMGAVALLLVLAGAIEGFLSASAAELGLRLVVTALSALLLIGYLLLGTMARRHTEGLA